MKQDRRGAVLLIVTLMLLFFSAAVVALITLSQSEWRAVSVQSDEMVLENLTVAGENMLLVLGTASQQERQMLGNRSVNPDFFKPQSLHWDDEATDPRFMLLPVKQFDPDEPLVFGWTNESAKLNLHSLVEWEQRFPGHGMRALLELPGMTAEVAAELLQRMGVKALVPDSMKSIAPQNNLQPTLIQERMPEQLEDLVGVGNTSYEDWFGKIDLVPNRQTNEQSRGTNRHQPWMEFLTLDSRERNESADGTSRIFLNQPDLVILHHRISEKLGQPLADFVVLYRQFGPGTVGRRTPVSDIKLDLSLPPRFELTSELDLVGSTVTIASNVGRSRLVMSPLPNDRAGWAGQLEFIMDQVTVDPQPVIEGRINIEHASREVLLAIPGMDTIIADQILSFRFVSADGRLSRNHAAWLLEKGVVDLPTMRRLLPYMTVSGNILQANIVAYDPFRELLLRKIVAIDATSPDRGKLYSKDLRNSPLPAVFNQLFKSGEPSQGIANR